MKIIKPINILVICAFVLSLLSYGGVYGFPITPKTNHGKKWRIGYLEGGPYINYPLNMRALAHALAELGWIQKVELPPQVDDTDTRALWKWLAKNTKSRFINFVGDAYWSTGWKNDRRKETRGRIIQRLNKRKDIDMMIAMGTWAGQDLAVNDHHTNVIVLSSSDPLRAGISKSVHYSGLDHVNARVDPTRYQRQIRIFHDIFHFRRLGIVYEDSVDGRTYAAVDDIEKMAKKLDFQLIKCQAPFSNISKNQAYKKVLKCIKELSPKIDAFYFTNHRGIIMKKLPDLLDPLYEKKIPTFSQVGSREVKHGVLLSIARAGFKYVAEFHAKTMAMIFNGAKPGELDQVFKDPPRIAINLEAAKIIGYDPPVDILGAADEIYETIPR